jgi:hypothetical protein
MATLSGASDRLTRLRLNISHYSAAIPVFMSTFP